MPKESTSNFILKVAAVLGLGALTVIQPESAIITLPLIGKLLLEKDSK